MATYLPLLVMTFAMVWVIAIADPDPLQDFCVADLGSHVLVNGFACKPAAQVTVNDFFFDGLVKRGDTNNKLGVHGTTADVRQIPGLNTLGVSLTRIDYAPGGLILPHTHPRATELVFVTEGQVYVGFITTTDVLFSRIVKKGEVFVIPRGLIHFEQNNNTAPASLIAMFNSQFSGFQNSSSLFTSSPPVPDDLLSKTFQVGIEEIKKIKSGLA